MTVRPHIVVAGAGAIGCFVGGLLVNGGCPVTLMVRPRIKAEIRTHGLSLTDFGGMAEQVDPDTLVLSEKPNCLAKADIILVTVKSGDTQEIARLINQHAPTSAKVVSLQNGISNAKELNAALPAFDVRGGMVPFNVVPMGQGGFHRATSGDIVIGAGAGDLGERLSVPYLRVLESREIESVQWGKLLINLNNALNALSGLPLKEQLRDRGWRLLMADQWQEAHAVMRRNGIHPVSTAPVSIRAIPWILRLPTPLFSRVAASMLTIDDQARTSMALDLMAGRETEVDALQGLVMELGELAGIPTPINAMVSDVVHTAEISGEGLPNLTVKGLRTELAQR